MRSWRSGGSAKPTRLTEAGRAFYESHGRWASNWTFGFERPDLPAVLSALRTRDWGLLDAVEKLAATRDMRRRGLMIFRVEHLPRGGPQQTLLLVVADRPCRQPGLFRDLLDAEVAGGFGVMIGSGEGHPSNASTTLTLT